MLGFLGMLQAALTVLVPSHTGDLFTALTITLAVLAFLTLVLGVLVSFRGSVHVRLSVFVATVSLLSSIFFDGACHRTHIDASVDVDTKILVLAMPLIVVFLGLIVSVNDPPLPLGYLFIGMSTVWNVFDATTLGIVIDLHSLDDTTAVLLCGTLVLVLVASIHYGKKATKRKPDRLRQLTSVSGGFIVSGVLAMGLQAVLPGTGELYVYCIGALGVGILIARVGYIAQVRRARTTPPQVDAPIVQLDNNIV
ncbi:Aste57867_12086 [Aphanomyces stellatus]|uniref:Aste57867_12086 protein n=1 Tax=Aphanomyces stellatus TaxID=120398 RepID=A0A485KVU9_9STRA|nr:hypothetical protein As57867_012041 [Aphanomyces stellatus]VFT88941.1 Aste57867_12086 [Aphanomyces stellatus]